MLRKLESDIENFMKSTEFDAELCYGCLLCRPGSEERLMQKMNKWIPEIRVFIAKQKHIVCKNGVHMLVSENALPGYVFFLARKDFDSRKLLTLREVREVLSNPDGTWMLQGEVRALAAFLYSKDSSINTF